MTFNLIIFLLGVLMLLSGIHFGAIYEKRRWKKKSSFLGHQPFKKMKVPEEIKNMSQEDALEWMENKIREGLNRL